MPEGFETDFASVPRWPLTFVLLGSYGHAAAVIMIGCIRPAQ